MLFITIVDLVHSVYREYNLYAIDIVFPVYTVASVNAVYTYTVDSAETGYVVDIVAIVFNAYN